MLVLNSGDALKNREKLVLKLADSLKENKNDTIYIVKEPGLRIRVQEMLATFGLKALVPNPVYTRDLFFKTDKATIHPAIEELYLEKILVNLKLEALAKIKPQRLTRPILEFIKELQWANLRPQDLHNGLKGELDTPKNRDLVRIYQAYTKLISTKKLVLESELAFKKIANLDLKATTIILDGFYNLELIDKKLIEKIAMRDDLTLIVNYPYLENDVFLALASDYQYLKGLASYEEIESPRSISQVTLCRPQTCKQEVSLVLKTIKKLFWEGKIESTDDVLILTNQKNLYQPILARLCEKEELNWRRGFINLSQTALMGEIKLLVAFLTRPLEKEELIALLRGKYFDFSRFLPGGISKARLSNMLTKIKLNGKSNNWYNKLKRMSEEQKECELTLQALQSLQKNLTLGAVKEEIEAQQISKIFSDILKNLKLEDNLLLDAKTEFEQLIELRAWFEVQTLWQTLVEAAKDEKFNCEDFLLAWLKRALSLRINIAEDGLSLHNLNEAPFRRCKYLFLLGVTEDDLPAKVSETWLFNDKERDLFNTLTGSQLLLAKKKEQLQDYYYWESLRCALNGVYLFSPDEIQGQYKEQSYYIDDLKDFGFCEPVLNLDFEPFYTSKTEYLEFKIQYEPLSLPDELQNKIAAYKTKPADYYNFPELGFLKSSDSSQARTLAVSAFSEYADCPYRFFVHKCLGLFETEELSEEVTSLEGGRLWHKVLESIYTDVAKYGTTKVLADLEVKFSQMVKQVFLDTKASNFYKRVELEKFYTSIKNYLKDDLARDNFQPVFLELHFGSGQSWPAVKMGPYFLKGVIDRVDLVTKGKKKGYLIIDYKRSKKDVAAVRNAKDFQLTVYIKALMQIGITPVLGASYLSLYNTESRFWNQTAYELLDIRTTKKPPTQKEWEEEIETLLQTGQRLGEQLFAGYYPPNYDSDSCRYCKFLDLCRLNTRGGVDTDE